MSNTRFIKMLTRSSFSYREGEAGAGDGGTGGGGAGGAGAGAAGAGGSGEEEKVYTKKDLDNHVTLVRKKYEGEAKKAVTDLVELKKNSQLTIQQKEALQSQIDTLEKQYMSEKELRDREHQQQIKAKEEENKKALSERDDFKKKYETYVTKTVVLATAHETGAVIPDQVYQILKDDLVLADELGDDGKPTGEQIPKVNFVDEDKEGKPIKMVMTVKDTIKRMTELPNRFGNLFKASGTGGVGSTTKEKSGGKGGPPADTEAYIAQRNAGRAK